MTGKEKSYQDEGRSFATSKRCLRYVFAKFTQTDECSTSNLKSCNIQLVFQSESLQNQSILRGYGASSVLIISLGISSRWSEQDGWGFVITGQCSGQQARGAVRRRKLASVVVGMIGGEGV
ncbi:hypothetical protein LOAG_02899 [Loa loa]|uniref:Uncharacterized protein n=1 Tax=Loa loa TaxID=7209 RepID=A0A1S0U5V1_LOALO|nr:hypothetical protein LOAG_02899 [Loa loa]EFO25591.1 hypothetical protein LOAG_02899 [Loa loa]